MSVCVTYRHVTMKPVTDDQRRLNFWYVSAVFWLVFLLCTSCSVPPFRLPSWLTPRSMIISSLSEHRVSTSHQSWRGCSEWSHCGSVHKWFHQELHQVITAPLILASACSRVFKTAEADSQSTQINHFQAAGWFPDDWAQRAAVMLAGWTVGPHLCRLTRRSNQKEERESSPFLQLTNFEFTVHCMWRHGGGVFRSYTAASQRGHSTCFGLYGVSQWPWSGNRGLVVHLFCRRLSKGERVRSLTYCCVYGLFHMCSFPH